jgi:predicted GNAT family acetyltransferase
MALKDWQAIEAADTKLVSPLTSQDTHALLQLYKLSYPHHAFDSRMLLTDQYYGVWEAGQLVSVAGIHVFSEQYRVAALGNITTHPNFQGKGLAAAATARLCKAIRKSVDHIGLNVKSDNQRALNLYQRLGFKSVAKYCEWVIEN